MNLGNEQRSGCPGVPHRCEHSAAVISQALEGIPSMMRLEKLREELEPCIGCIQALEFEVRFKIAMAQRCREEVPLPLQLRISETLRRVDLGDIDVSDL